MDGALIRTKPIVLCVRPVEVIAGVCFRGSGPGEALYLLGLQGMVGTRLASGNRMLLSLMRSRA